MKNLVEIQEWDTSHFGFKIARMNAETPEELQLALERCATSRVKLLIYRCSTDSVHFINQLQEQGFELMSTNLRYYLSLTGAEVTDVPGPAVIRLCLDTEVDNLTEVARTAFTVYFGHFHNDPRLDRAKCDAIYVEWAYNLCVGQKLADLLLVAEMDGEIVGFDSHKLIEPKVADGILSAVVPEAQGRGIRKALMIASINWCISNGIERMEEGVDINNYGIQRVLTSLGMRMYASSYVFHKWF